MGEAKRRGTPRERAEQAQAKEKDKGASGETAQARAESLRPAQLVCGACKTAFSKFDAIAAPDLNGIDAIFGGQCPACGNDVLVFKGEPQAVADAMLAWERMMGADAKLGYQSRDGQHVPFEDEADPAGKTRH